MLLLSATVSLPLAAQVGIRTEDPRGMLHVDAKGDTQGSLNTGDDVIVTLQGNVGIGTLPETASDTLPLRLTDGGTPALPRSPLRIEDGNEREGRVLTSDASGRGAWKNLPPQFTPGRVYGLQGVPAMNLPYGGGPYTVFTFTADVAGSYLFEIRWRGRLKGQTILPFAIFGLHRGSLMVDSFEQYFGSNPDDINTFSLCLTLYGKALAAGDVFTLRVTVSGANIYTNHGQNTQVTPPWTQAKVNVLRVN